MKFLLFAAAIAFIWWVVRAKVRPRETMTTQAAARLLGIDANADAGTIIDAHKKLIGKVHPDTGGTVELAAQVNQARDLLLSRLSKSRT